MAIVELKAQRREPGGSAVARRMRRAGNVPVVIYGHGLEAVHLSVDLKAVDLAITGRAHRFRFNLGDSTEQVVLKDAAYDHLGDGLLHADFLRVKLDEPVEIPVAVDVTGHPKGMAEGGILEQHMTEVTVRCLPDRIPQVITLEVNDLGLHEAVRIKEIDLPEGVEIVGEPELPVVSVVARYKAQAEETTEGEGEGEEGEGTAPSDDGETGDSKPSES